MSLTTKTPEHVVLAYNLPRGRADRGKVAEAAQETVEVEAPHAAQAAGGGWYVGNSGEGRRGDNPLHPLEIPEQRAYRSQVDDADVR